MAQKRLVIIDGYSLLYRAFFATRYLSTSDGRPTNALYTFVNMLFYLLENTQPDCIVVAFDAPGKTFRHAEYAEYKGTRRETPEELKAQFPGVRDLMGALGIPSIELTGYEADDIVGTISRLGEENGYDTTIVTGDLDALQLVDDHVSVLTTGRGVTETVTYTPEKVMERYGFGAELVPDYKSIVGDTSDNIPGVPGIGEKGATAILQQFGTIEEVLARFDELDPKFQKKIDPVREQMAKSKWLATIDRHVPIEFDFEPFVVTADELSAAKSHLEMMEFKSHVRRADAVLGRYIKGASREKVEVKVESFETSLVDLGQASDLVKFVGDSKFAVHFEVDMASQGSIFEEPKQWAYLAVDNKVARCSESVAKQFLALNLARAIFHDAKPLYKKNLDWSHVPGFDTMLAGFVLQSGRTSYNLRDLIQGYLEMVPTKSEDVASGIWKLEPEMRKKLALEGQTAVLEDIELPLIPILAQIENTGVETSPDFLNEFSKSLQIEIERLTASIHILAGAEFNIGSPKQLGEVLFEKLGIPGQKKTKTGYATGVEVLQLLAPTHPICAEVLNWRELSKLKSTYADSLPKMIKEDGRIHTTYNQAGAATGRLSSNDPNLQNIPIRTELGRQIRKAFVAADGFELLSLDYSQIELRVLAHLCEDEALVEAFRLREDVHTVTAASMYGVPLTEVSREQRGYSKMLNYAVSYGVTDFGLAQQLGGGFSISEARDLITQYYERFPKIKAFMDGVIATARSKGFTTTICGRRRHFPDIHDANRNVRMGAERQAMNAPIQGAAADMMKLAIAKVHHLMQGKKSRMLLTVHDELVFELHPSEHEIIADIRSAMERALPLSVPIEVDAKKGPNWSEMVSVPR